MPSPFDAVEAVLADLTTRVSNLEAATASQITTIVALGTNEASAAALTATAPRALVLVRAKVDASVDNYGGIALPDAAVGTIIELHPINDAGGTSGENVKVYLPSGHTYYGWGTDLQGSDGFGITSGDWNRSVGPMKWVKRDSTTWVLS